MTSATHRFGWAALVGPPNAGKSSLMNSLLGQKLAIVTAKPQTTRNRLSGILTAPGLQVAFLDTPGLNPRPGRMNRFLNESAKAALADSDAVVVVLDAARLLDRPKALEADLATLARPVIEAGRPVLVALNKVDLVRDKARLLPLMQALSARFPGAPLLPVSARRAEGLDALLSEVAARLPEGPPLFPADQLSTAPLRFLAAEIIREKLFVHLSQELPYATAVEIDLFEEGPEATHIAATVYVGREGHKPMVIGRGGQMLKTIGSEARAELVELLESKVRLDLFVKVREGWTEDQGFLRSLGFGE
jgi:GTP-binding protein Era